jgi:flagellar biosynthetic protein FlhB
LLSIQLQRFAGSSSSGEKTERATPRRRQEARREGNVPKSVELSAAIGLLGAMVVLRIVGGKVWGAWMEMFRHDIANAAAVHMTVEAVIEMLSSQVGYVIGGLLPVVLVAFGLSILADNRSQSTRKKKTAKVCFNYICVKIFIVIVVAYSF